MVMMNNDVDEDDNDKRIDNNDKANEQNNLPSRSKFSTK